MLPHRASDDVLLEVYVCFGARGILLAGHLPTTDYIAWIHALRTILEENYGFRGLRNQPKFKFSERTRRRLLNKGIAYHINQGILGTVWID